MTVTAVKGALGEADFQVGVGSEPDKRKPGHPIFAIDGLARVGLLLFIYDARRGSKLRSCNFAANRARCDLDLRIISNTLGLAHVAAGHDIKLVVFFAKPHRSSDRHAALTESGKRDVFLKVNGGRNGARHNSHFSFKLPGMVRLRAGTIDPPLRSVLKANHAQMDA